MADPADIFDADLERLLRGEAPETIAPASDPGRQADLQVAERLQAALGTTVSAETRARIWARARGRPGRGGVRRLGRRRILIGLAATSIAGVAAGLGIAAGRSPVGSPLYGVRSAIETTRLEFMASETARAELAVDQFASAAAEMRTQPLRNRADLAPAVNTLGRRGGRLVEQMLRLAPDQRRWVGPRAVWVLERHRLDIERLRLRASSDARDLLDSYVAEARRRISALRALIPDAVRGSISPADRR